MRPLSAQGLDTLTALTTYYTQLANIAANAWRAGEIAKGRSGNFTTAVLDSIYAESRKWMFMVRFYANQLHDHPLTDRQFNALFEQNIQMDFDDIEFLIEDEDHTRMIEHINQVWKWIGSSPILDASGNYRTPNHPSFTYGLVYGDNYNPPPMR
jgi:hypothetical protein